MLHLLKFYYAIGKLPFPIIEKMLRTTDAHNFIYVKLAQEQIYGKPKINVKSCTNIIDRENAKKSSLLYY